MTFGSRCAGADADDSFRRRANWHLCPFRCVRRRATRACPHAPFSHRQSPRTCASSRSRAPRIASRPARRRSLFRRALPPRVMANVRHVPTVPFAASAMEGAVRKRATLSDTENLAVGAFGGVLETCIQSTSRSRSRARASASTPLPTAPLGRIRFFVISSGEGVPAAVPRRRPRAASERSARKRATRARACHRSDSRPNPLLSPPRRPQCPLSRLRFACRAARLSPRASAAGTAARSPRPAPLAPITACQVAVNGAIERAVPAATATCATPSASASPWPPVAASSVLYSPVDLVVIQQQQRGWIRRSRRSAPSRASAASRA